MTLLLETHGKGPMYTLWTHDTSIGNTWQRLCPQSKCGIIAQSSRWFIFSEDLQTLTICFVLNILCTQSISDTLANRPKHLVNKGPFTCDDLQTSHRHLVNKGPFTWDHSQRSHRHLVNKGPFTSDCSQSVYVTFPNRPK
jgi:hypothetical protein